MDRQGRAPSARPPLRRAARARSRGAQALGGGGGRSSPRVGCVAAVAPAGAAAADHAVRSRAASGDHHRRVREPVALRGLSGRSAVGVRWLPTPGRNQLWVRSLDSLDAQRCWKRPRARYRRSGRPTAGSSASFRHGDGELRRRSTRRAAPARTICAAQSDGAPAWGRDGTILFTQFRDGIFGVSAEGGTPVRVTTVDKSQREMNHYWPSFLPDGRRFPLHGHGSREPTGARETPSVYVASLDRPESETYRADAFADGLHAARACALRAGRRADCASVRRGGAPAGWRADTDRRRRRLRQGTRQWRIRRVGQTACWRYLAARSDRVARLVRQAGHGHRDRLAASEFRLHPIVAGWPTRGRRCARSADRGHGHLDLRYRARRTGAIHRRRHQPEPYRCGRRTAGACCSDGSVAARPISTRRR